jgi:uncharacterized protein YndB with AHSA1/START domain
MEQTATAPVRLSVTVKATQQKAFTVFTENISDWWPVVTHSIEGDDVMSAKMECREGGRIFEFRKDGSEANWGLIRVWEPPNRLVFSWNPSYEARPETEVEVRFVPESDVETTVHLEHRHWEKLGDRAADFRAGYAEGWAPVLDRYAARASD